ncbi:cupin domain-containing protein [Paenibacillus sp. DMB20]|uniref:cupin domain-containing protein n=1 Tax=Paenibacillus sp. DMB20 TaxID=1642570 RepID=UPI00062808F6|nr:cupin domain-containing protein [Paenibacillus sp. DMB20]KKO53364.1 hypothetical protein XI25_13730 [Paenibacillus sp. DMB20]
MRFQKPDDRGHHDRIIWNAMKHRSHTLTGSRADLAPDMISCLKSLSMTDAVFRRGHGTAPHRHPDSDELLYVLSGDISFSSLDPVTGIHQSSILTPGSAAFITAGQCHWFVGLTEESRILSIYNEAEPHVIEVSDTWNRQNRKQGDTEENGGARAVPVHHKRNNGNGDHAHDTVSGGGMAARRSSNPAPPWVYRGM